MGHRALALGVLLFVGTGLCVAGETIGVSASTEKRPVASLPDGVEAPVRKNHGPRPEYPYAAKTQKMEGRVIVRIRVREDGTVDFKEILSCETRKKSKKKYKIDPTRECLGFAHSAREAVTQWRFYPATRDGEPVEVDFTAVVEFELG